MNHIKNLELADNKLKSIKFIVENFPKIDRLQLSRNTINDIEGVSKLKYLIKLNLRNNQLSVLPDEICSLCNLEGLNIRHNKLTALP
jgi:Leucine-rich repeat (LRR) protein